MKASVQARLDEETQAALKRLLRANGWTISKALRECVLRVDGESKPKPRPRLVGIGCVDFGPGDMATNKKYMEGFGLRSMGKGWRPPMQRAQ
jgi:hypothetical protein